MRRWVARLLAVAIVALGLPAVAGVGPAAAAPGYIDGGFSNSTITNCGSIIFGSPYSEFGLMTYAGYYGDLNSNPPTPKVGDIFYVHVVVAGAGNACSGQLAWVDLDLPNGLNPAISNTNPVLCYYTNTQHVTGGVPCKGMNSPFRPGAISITQPGNTYGTEVWAVPTGGILDLRLPVTASQAGAMTLQGYVQASDGNANPLLTPRVGMYVAPNGNSGPPAITYRSPSTEITPGAHPTTSRWES